MNTFFVAASTATVADACGGLEPIVRVVYGLFNIIRIIVPIALLIFGALDLAKAVMASDEKEIKGATTKFIKRAVAAVAVFFAVTLVTVVMTIVAKGEGTDGGVTSQGWLSCWNSVVSD